MSTYIDKKYRHRTDAWLKANGIGVNQIYVGTKELFQAQKLVANTLRQHGQLLEQNQTVTLHNFLRNANGKHREKITQGQCFRVMNIVKQIQRKYAKLTKRKIAGTNHGTSRQTASKLLGKK